MGCKTRAPERCSDDDTCLKTLGTGPCKTTTLDTLQHLRGTCVAKDVSADASCGTYASEDVCTDIKCKWESDYATDKRKCEESNDAGTDCEGKQSSNNCEWQGEWKEWNCAKKCRVLQRQHGSARLLP